MHFAFINLVTCSFSSNELICDIVVGRWNICILLFLLILLMN